MLMLTWQRRWSMSAIGTLIDHGHPVSHSTIIHGYKKAKELIDNDSDYHDILKKAESNI